MPISRRQLFPLAALAATGLAQAQSVRETLKITRFVVHKVSLRWRDLLFLEVQTDGGLKGLGEATLEGRTDLVETALRWLEKDFVGRDPSGLEEHWDRAYYQLSRWRNGPAIMSAISAVDIALWDLAGKRLGLPVWRLLGGSLRTKSRVYYTHWGARLEAKRSPEAFRDWAIETKKNGWTAVKWTLANNGSEAERIAQSVLEIEAVRKAVGNSLDICLEAAETFSPRSAVQFIRAVSPFNPLWIEEPTLRENPSGLGEVAAKSFVPVASGEGLLSRFEFKALLDAHGASVVQPDVLHAGGITEVRKIANLAETYGIEIAPHQCSGPVGHVASLSAMSVCRNFLIQEWEAADDLIYREMTSNTYPVQSQGYVTLSEAPGLGLQLDFREFARRFPYQETRRKALLR
jgi:galactonate dehydratase